MPTTNDPLCARPTCGHPKSAHLHPGSPLENWCPYCECLGFIEASAQPAALTDEQMVRAAVPTTYQGQPLDGFWIWETQAAFAGSSRMRPLGLLGKTWAEARLHPTVRAYEASLQPVSEAPLGGGLNEIALTVAQMQPALSEAEAAKADYYERNLHPHRAPYDTDEARERRAAHVAASRLSPSPQEEAKAEQCGSVTDWPDESRVNAVCVRPKGHSHANGLGDYHGTEQDVLTSEGGYFWHDHPSKALSPQESAAQPAPWEVATKLLARAKQAKEDGEDWVNLSINGAITLCEAQLSAAANLPKPEEPGAGDRVGDERLRELAGNPERFIAWNVEVVEMALELLAFRAAQKAQGQGFEEWAPNHGLSLERAHVRGVTYRFDETEYSWMAWQAATAVASGDVERLTKNAEAAWRQANVAHQHTRCCVCDIDKHTPVRNDSLGGYICGGCLENAYEGAEARAETAERALQSHQEMLASVELPPLDVTDDDRLQAQERLAGEYGTNWEGLCASMVDENRATDVLMDLSATEAAYECARRQLKTSQAALHAEQAVVADLQARLREKDAIVRGVEAAFARRPALDDCKTTIDKAWHACETASKLDRQRITAENERDDAKRKAEAAEQALRTEREKVLSEAKNAYEAHHANTPNGAENCVTCGENWRSGIHLRVGESRQMRIEVLIPQAKEAVKAEEGTTE